MEFGEKFRQEGRVLSRNGEDAEAADVLWCADNIPSNFALPPSAMVIASPEEGAPAFVNCLDHPRREEAGTHGVGEHGSENGVNEDETTADGK
jgi:hypothetical protein